MHPGRSLSDHHAILDAICARHAAPMGRARAHVDRNAPFNDEHLVTMPDGTRIGRRRVVSASEKPATRIWWGRVFCVSPLVVPAMEKALKQGVVFIKVVDGVELESDVSMRAWSLRALFLPSWGKPGAERTLSAKVWTWCQCRPNKGSPGALCKRPRLVTMKFRTSRLFRRYFYRESVL